MKAFDSDQDAEGLPTTTANDMNNPKKTLIHLSGSNQTRILSFALLVFLGVTTQITFKVSQVGGSYRYNTMSAMTVVEIIKFLLSYLQYVRLSGEQCKAVIGKFRLVNQKVVRNYLLLAIAYAVYNQLIFIVLEITDPGTFSLFKSLTPLMVGVINWAVMGNSLSHLHCICILMQVFGIIPVVHTEDVDKRSTEGMFYMVFVCLMASFNTVYNAAIIKRDDTPIEIQNMMLYAFGAVTNYFFYVSFRDPNNNQNFFFGYDHWGVILHLFLSSFVGIAITHIYKYGDAVLKTLAAPLVSAILVFLSYIFFGLSMNLVKMSGGAIVILNTILYFQLPTPTNKTPDLKTTNSNKVECLIQLGMFIFIFAGLQFISNKLHMEAFSNGTQQKHQFNNTDVVLSAAALRNISSPP